MVTGPARRIELHLGRPIPVAGLPALDDAATIVQLVADMAAERPDAPAGEMIQHLRGALPLIGGGRNVLVQTQKDLRSAVKAEIAAEKAKHARFNVVDVTEIVAAAESDMESTL